MGNAISRHRRPAGPAPAARLRACEDGAVAVEYAMIAPAFMALLLGILQTGVLFLSQQGLETAAEDATRLILTGQAQKSSLTAAQFRSRACQSLPHYLSCTNLMVDVTTISSYSAAQLGPPTITYDASGNVSNSFTFSTGGRNSIVVLRLMYMMPVIGAPLGYNISNQPSGKRLLIATSVFRNEYYS